MYGLWLPYERNFVSRMSYMMCDECDSGRMPSAAASYGEEHASSEREDVTISQLRALLTKYKANEHG